MTKSLVALLGSGATSRFAEFTDRLMFHFEKSRYAGPPNRPQRLLFHRANDQAFAGTPSKMDPPFESSPATVGSVPVAGGRGRSLFAGTSPEPKEATHSIPRAATLLAIAPAKSFGCARRTTTVVVVVLGGGAVILDAISVSGLPGWKNWSVVAKS